MQKRLANRQGDAKAQAEACYSLAGAYGRGEGVAKDEREMVEWLTKAAGLNHAGAQYNLGTCYERGKGVAQSYEKAFDWYQKAANQGYEQPWSLLPSGRRS